MGLGTTGDSDQTRSNRYNRQCNIILCKWIISYGYLKRIILVLISRYMGKSFDANVNQSMDVMQRSLSRMVVLLETTLIARLVYKLHHG